MKNIFEFTKIYCDFAQIIRTQFSLSIKVCRTDNAMEYKNSEFLDFIHMTLYVIALVQALLNKMGELNVRTYIF